MTGKVYLVGAGPGDYGLLTLKGLECIKQSDVIVYDRLANAEYLKEAKEDCVFIYVGKQSSNHTKTQDEINDVIVEEAKKGRIVTRLKGGDPYVFGRGGEEGQYLLQHNVPFEVVPGITSAIGGLCYAGIPITHRDYASSFHIVTGHLKDDEHTSINWRALADMGGTIVFLMGVSNLGKICCNLMQEGMVPTIPVAVINWATRWNQKVATGTLETIEEEVQKAGLTSPSLIVVGEVVRLRDTLNFFEQKPLFGKTIITTRARAQASTLTHKLETLGARVIEFPTIAIQEIKPNTAVTQAIEGLGEYSYVIFTSQNAVRIFFEVLEQEGRDTRALANIKVVAIGEATKSMLKQYGIIPDFMPERFVAESVCDLLEPMLESTDCILVPKAEETRHVLKDRLSNICKVDEVAIYRNVLDTTAKEAIIKQLEEGIIDYITFTSASTVKHFMTLIEGKSKALLDNIKLVAIGEITSETMQQEGLQVYAVPNTYTIDGMIECIVQKEGEKNEE